MYEEQRKFSMYARVIEVAYWQLKQNTFFQSAPYFEFKKV